MMTSTLRLERLTEANFDAFSSLIDGEDRGCFCSFWYQKFGSMEEWDRRKAEAPALNEACVRDKVRSRFHVGVLAYRGEVPVAWIAVAPLPEIHWAWRRVAQLGEAARDVAAIPCITRATDWRDRLTERELLAALIDYGRGQGWKAIEGYPFDREAIDRHGDSITWPGFPEDFAAAGFERAGTHWLGANPGYERSIWRIGL